MTNRRAPRKLVKIAIAAIGSLWPLMACADGGAAPPDAVVQQLMAQDMPEVSGKEIRMLSVEYGSGAASLLHRHNAQVFVYVLEGAVRMQVEGKAALTLNPGETFYEDPGRVVRVIGSLI